MVICARESIRGGWGLVGGDELVEFGARDEDRLALSIMPKPAFKIGPERIRADVNGGLRLAKPKQIETRTARLGWRELR